LICWLKWVYKILSRPSPAHNSRDNKAKAERGRRTRKKLLLIFGLPLVPGSLGNHGEVVVVVAHSTSLFVLAAVAAGLFRLGFPFHGEPLLHLVLGLLLLLLFGVGCVRSRFAISVVRDAAYEVVDRPLVRALQLLLLFCAHDVA